MSNVIGICSVDDVDDLMAFFHEHWAPNHPFTRRRDLLDWQHLKADGLHYNFMLSRDAHGSVNGMMGFIPSDRFDPTLAGAHNTIWQSTWMVLRSDETRGLGQALLQEALATHDWGWTGTCGLDHGTRKIYERLGYRTGVLYHYYMLNHRTEQFRLAVVPPDLTRCDCDGAATLAMLDRDGFMEATNGYGLDDGPLVPRKTRTQFYNRYVLHPFYSYALYLVRDDKHAAILVTRLCSHGGATALRLVDFLGAPQAMRASGTALQSVLADTGAEFLDFYCSGMADEIAAAGFRNINDAEGLILPNHFEPFEQRNIELLYALRGNVDRPDEQIVICKGDGDQDRPNLLSERHLTGS